MGLKDIAAKKPTAAKKAAGIILEVTPEMQAEIDVWVENNRAQKDAKANMEQSEGVLLEVVEAMWRQKCRDNGAAETSAKLGSIRVSWKGKTQFLTSSSVGDGERVKAIFGDDYDKYFKEVEDYSITPEAANNPEIAEEIGVALGIIGEKYGISILTAKTKVVAKEQLHNDWVMGDVEDINEKLLAAGAKRTKPTFAQR